MVEMTNTERTTQFKKDLNGADLNEKFVAGCLTNVLPSLVKVKKIPGRHSPYDLKCQFSDREKLLVECKEDKTCIKWDNIFVEFMCSNKPSGILTTEADWYAITAHNKNKKDINVYFIEVDILKQMIEQNKYFRMVNGGDQGRAEGFLFKRKVIETNSLSKYSFTLPVQEYRTILESHK